jgi:MATE family multidrug resistance protein
VNRGALRVPTRHEIRDVAGLALPIVSVQLGLMLMGVVDAAMVGRYSSSDLAGVALGNTYWVLASFFSQGTIMALDPIVSQAVGARDEVAVARGLQRGLVLAVFLSGVSSLILLPGDALFRLLEQPADAAPIGAAYARWSIPGVLPYLTFVVLRQTLQAFQRIRPILLAVIAGNLSNVFLNWVLIFGNLGATPMGGVGSAIASSISRWLMLVFLAIAAWPTLRPYAVPFRRDAFALGPLVRMLRLGIPIGLHITIEIGCFGGALMLVGLLGTIPLAGHQITITLAALTYMVPMGVAAAAAVLVGHAIGRADPDAARREASAALACGVGFMAATCIVLVSIPGPLARLFTSDVAVIAAAVALIPIAGVFQVFDGIQGVSAGILRGAGDTRVPMFLNLLGFLGIGLPIGAWLGFTQGLGAPGIWWGLVVGLVVVSALLGWRVHSRLGGRLERVRIDERTTDFATPAVVSEPS